MATAILRLPSELIQHVLTFVDIYDLPRIAETCRRLRDEADDELIWQSIVNEQLPQPAASAGSLTFRNLFRAHHLYWFLVKRRIWFSDTEPSGKLVFAHFNEGESSIEAHTVVAARGHHTLSFWEKDPNVIIHSFDPHIALDTRPVIRITPNSHNSGDNASDLGFSTGTDLGKEIPMDTFGEEGLFSSFMLCRSLPPAAISASTSVWPPLRFPSKSRTRNASSGMFRSVGHRPTRLNEVSQSNFRVKKWVEYSKRRSSPSVSVGSHTGLAAALGIGMPFFAAATNSPIDSMPIQMPNTTITTFSTLPEECYIPTPEKPWQGIWCGDYSGHGCEFILITQPDEEDEQDLPEGMDYLSAWLDGRLRRASDSSSETGSFVSAMEDPSTEEHRPTPSSAQQEGPRGRIEAIKLTGDPNIPRGEYTFIAPDIGDGGLVRVADEETFRGARIVRSAGHIAGRGFVRNQYTPSQLIMISHDRLAQYWETFGHISYYLRIDLESLLKR